MPAVNTPVNTLGAATTLTQAAVGTISQGTNISTGVTLTNLTGVITTQAATAAANAGHLFTVTNTLVTANSVVVASIIDYTGAVDGSAGIPSVFVDSITTNAFNIVILNGGSSALAGTFKIAFQVLAA
jgi:hypothetical protein